MKQIKSLEDLKGFTGLVLFTAPYCSPCKTYKPFLEDFARRSEVNLGLVDVQEAPALAGTYGVRSVPTTFIFVNGSPFTQRIGALTEQALLQMFPRA